MYPVSFGKSALAFLPALSLTYCSPLIDFMTQWGPHFHTKEAKTAFFTSVLRPVCETFDILAVQVMQSAAELERSLKHRKAQRQGGSKDIDSVAISDTEKMRRQFVLDLEALKM